MDPTGEGEKIELKPEERDVPGTADADGKPLRGRPYDRKGVSLMRKQSNEARSSLLEALQNKELEAIVDSGPLVPMEYWSTNGSATTVHTGALSLGPATKLEKIKSGNITEYC